MSARRYSAACKYEAVRRVVEDGRSVTDVAREMGVSEGSLFFWLRRYRQFTPAYGQARAEPPHPARSLVAYLRRARAG
jgi:transposase-like protein